MNKPEFYDWWVDVLQDCLAQIAREYDKISNEGVCKHMENGKNCLREETHEDFNNYINCIKNNKFCDIPEQIFAEMERLNKATNLEDDQCQKSALDILNTNYFSTRARWKC